MKTAQNLVLVGLISSVAAFASTPEQAYLESCRKDPGVPVPIVVVSPSVGSEYEGASVQLEFLVDARGKPTQFAIKATPDDILAAKVVAAVKQWRFQPAEVDGTPVPMKVALPVRIVESNAGESLLVARNSR